MAEQRNGSQLSRIARGIAFRASRELRKGVGAALAEVRQPVERALRQWVGDRIPRRRQYEGARGGRRGDGWTAGSTGANAEILRDLAKLRDRARDLGRNDPIAARILEALTIHTVGTGILPKSATGSALLDARVDALWTAWARQARADGQRGGIYSLQALAIRGMFEGGESLIRRVPRKTSDGLTLPLQIDVLEGDYLDHLLGATWTGGTAIPDGHYIVQGVEFDAGGRRVAYHLWKQHPGETTTFGARQTMQRIRVDAADLSHVYRQIRAGQVRGVTVLAPVMWTLRQIGLYLDAELERKGTEALVVGVVSNAEPGRAGLGDLETETTADGDLRVIGSMEPGTMVNVDGATSVQFNHPVPTDTAEAVKGFLRRISAGVGMPYELLSADLSGVNYSSIRYGTLPFRLAVWMLQEHVVIPLACDPVWEWFIETAIATGQLEPRAGGYPVKWAPPRWEEVDRLKEAMADIAEIRAGLRSYQDVLASRGESWADVMREAKEYLAAMNRHGLSFDSDPRRPQTAAAPAVDPATDPAPADKPDAPRIPAEPAA